MLTDIATAPPPPVAGWLPTVPSWAAVQHIELGSLKVKDFLKLNGTKKRIVYRIN